MRSSNIVLLVIVLLVLIAGALFFVIDDSKENENEGIDPKKYDKTGEGFVSEDPFSDDEQCKKEFGGDWYYVEDEDRCVCVFNRILDPVCGDDDKDYSNPSEASCEGVDVAYGGECGGSDVDEELECVKCGSDGCVWLNPNLDRECSADEAGYECKVVDGDCRKIEDAPSESICGNNVCEMGEGYGDQCFCPENAKCDCGTCLGDCGEDLKWFRSNCGLGAVYANCAGVRSCSSGETVGNSCNTKGETCLVGGGLLYCESQEKNFDGIV